MTTGEARYLSRAEAAEFLTERGYKTAPSTLAKKAVVGGGPPFVSWGRKPLYNPESLLEWAQRRCTGPRRSTSDRGEERQHDDRLGDPQLADIGDLDQPIEEISAGISPQQQKPGHPTPPAGESPPVDFRAPPDAQQKCRKSNARGGPSLPSRSVSGEKR